MKPATRIVEGPEHEAQLSTLLSVKAMTIRCPGIEARGGHAQAVCLTDARVLVG